jgi:ribosomal protein S6
MAREKIETPEVDDAADHAEMRVYELGFHIDAELPQEEAKQTYQSFKDLIAKNGSVVAEGELEKIPLAYTISRMETTGRRDFNSAYFGWIAYEAAGAGHAAITEGVRANTKVVRFLDIRTTKDAAKHAAEMHEIYMKMPVEEIDSSEEETAPVVDTEIDAVLKEAGV